MNVFGPEKNWYTGIHQTTINTEQGISLSFFRLLN
jgi:hypothetical protein